MGWKNHSERTKPQCERFKSIVDKLEKLKDMQAEDIKTKMTGLTDTINSEIKVRTQKEKQDALAKQTTATTAATGIVKHRFSLQHGWNHCRSSIADSS